MTINYLGECLDKRLDRNRWVMADGSLFATDKIEILSSRKHFRYSIIKVYFDYLISIINGMLFRFYWVSHHQTIKLTYSSYVIYYRIEHVKP